MMELLIGSGHSRKKKITFPEIPVEWSELVTLDIDSAVGPDIVHDLNNIPYPFDDNMFDEIHAYEVLEHCGRQGDWRFFFNQFEEFWRILKPGGFLIGTCPQWDSVWAWSDPGHTRIISPESMIFLDQSEYEQCGRTAMTDYRDWYKGDFERYAIDTQSSDDSFGFVLKARK